MSEPTAEYSLENARRFRWSSITGLLNSERVAHLDKYLVGRKILDAGCGGGGYVEFLAARGLEVTGVDFHPEFLPSPSDPARRGTYVQGDITQLQFPAAHFDSTFCYDVLEHVDDGLALRELVRVTRRRLILAVPAHDNNVVDYNFTFAHYRDLTHLRTYTEESLAGLIQGCGQTRFQLYPELPLDFCGLASHHLTLPADGNFAVTFLRRVYRFGLRKLLSRARYPTIHAGWVAVIDLGEDQTFLPSPSEQK